MGYADFVNWLSATKVGGRLTRATAAKVDPWIYRRTNGRFVLAGRPTIPQITLTTTGRRSGHRREVQLAALADGDDFVVVASNFGQEHHPAWMYNLEADPRAWVRHGADELEVTARSLSAEEKEAVWPRLHAIVPQFRTYLDRTDRDIRIFRLSPA
jgi:deazaflavin-dependent oxidoreductase (nitroreductase family)